VSTASDGLRTLLAALFEGGPPIRIELWDGSTIEPARRADEADEPPPTLIVRSPDALRRILWAPSELGLGRAYVAGDLDVPAGADIVATLEALSQALGRRARSQRFGLRSAKEAAVAAFRIGAVGRPLPPPRQEAHLRGWRHSLRRDASAIHHHYDTGNDFYRVVLGPSMTYSCARFVDDTVTLDEAQEAKHDLVARKLGLHARATTTGSEAPSPARLLDVGCGWGSMAIHAASRYGVSVVGITISQEQAKLARERVEAAGVGHLVDIRLQDYRELGDEQFDAISSIGMSEHVGSAKIDTYFAALRRALRPHGRLLNHAITTVGGSKLGRASFVGRYVFPDGELIDVGDLVLAMERAGFEVRDVESLREHYARTLRAWVANLEDGWDDAVAAADRDGEPGDGLAKARIWRLYMAASAVGFTDGGIAIHQILGVVPDDRGGVAMPPTRREWG
jgi:cyclopropane-fatty-acyl-phospholipid synthase